MKLSAPLGELNYDGVNVPIELNKILALALAEIEIDVLMMFWDLDGSCCCDVEFRPLLLAGTTITC
jgi:hypothetical protein